MQLCKYKDALGTPGEGAHSVRIFGIAIVDLVLTIVVAWFLHVLLGAPLLESIIIMFLFGIIMHRVFCVRTTVDRLLFR